MNIKQSMSPLPKFIVSTTDANPITKVIPTGNYSGLAMTFSGVHTGSVARAALTQKVEVVLNGEVISHALIKDLIAIDNNWFGYMTETVGTTFKYYCILPTAFSVSENDNCSVNITDIYAGATSNANRVELINASNLMVSYSFKHFTQSVVDLKTVVFSNLAGIYFAPATETNITYLSAIDVNSKIQLFSSTFAALKDASLTFANVEATEVGLLIMLDRPRNVEISITASTATNVRFVSIGDRGLVSPIPPAQPQLPPITPYKKPYAPLNER